MMASLPRYSSSSHLPLSDDFDVILVVQGEQFKAHRVILASKSPVFHRMFSSYAKNQDIVLENISPPMFHRVLEFLYTSQLRVCCSHSAVVLLEIAGRYLMDELLDQLQDWLMRNVKLPDFCELFMIADIYGLPCLKQSFKERIASQLDVISMDSSFPRLNIRLVEELLQCSADLEKIRHDVTYELEAVTAIVRWLALRGGYSRIEGVEKCNDCINLDQSHVKTNIIDWTATGSSAGVSGVMHDDNRIHYEERLLRFVNLRNATDQDLGRLNHIANTQRLDVLRMMVQEERELRYQPHPWCDCE